ncbi:LANO_0G17172g1_1 [Lachancea nothofagi CBS 11611]|uniref:LANO_0G17172g1_1 n=1 Tax=Lachancea nothofagi CBS 11611 TaxID=1266666 RepID=A0A1G4KKN9_9SACH|nr:LANO_0G17172g1_1 [Lachancea nothofagi CBS 11611]
MTALQSQRLPTLYEVLNRQTTTPADLWSFYTYLSQYPYAINFLDFWIDAMAHLRLCKDYVRGIRESVVEWEESQERTNNTGDNSGETRENRDSMTSSLLLEALMNDGFLDFEDSKRVSQFLQGQTDSPRLTKLLGSWQKQTDQEDSTGAPFKSPLTGLVDEFLKTQAHDSHKAQITSKQLLTNAQTIVDTYLKSPSESPRYLINLPDHMRQTALYMVQTEKRHDPDVFEQLKSIAFQFLELDCFPKFLTCVALHNLHDDITIIPAQQCSEKRYTSKRKSGLFSQYSSLSRIVLGLIFLWLGFWLGYVLVFLNYSRGIRVTTIVPFLLGFYFLWCGIYQIDILFALCGVTQTLVSNDLVSSKDLEMGLNRNSVNHRMGHQAPFIFRLLGGTSRLVKVRHPLINSMLKRRAWWCLFLVLVGTGIFTVIFSCVPGHRL